MKVSMAIKLLTEYHNPDEELIINWWNKATVEEYFTDKPLGDNWDWIVSKVEDDEALADEYTRTIVYWLNELEEVK